MVVLQDWGGLRSRDRRSETTEAPTMTIAWTPPRSGSVDPDTGQLRPQTDQERQARAEALRRAFDEIGAITDETDTDEIWRDVMRGIDENRPHRPLFEGAY